MNIYVCVYAHSRLFLLVLICSLFYFLLRELGSKLNKYFTSSFLLYEFEARKIYFWDKIYFSLFLYEKKIISNKNFLQFSLIIVFFLSKIKIIVEILSHSTNNLFAHNFCQCGLWFFFLWWTVFSDASRLK